jgi:hypothetical protein
MKPVSVSEIVVGFDPRCFSGVGVNTNWGLEKKFRFRGSQWVQRTVSLSSPRFRNAGVFHCSVILVEVEQTPRVCFAK